MSENRRRERNKLSTRLVQTITTPGRHSDGGGLYLIVDKSGARRWLFIFRWKGRQPEMGLGGFPATSLANARKQALEAEALVRSGINPIEHRKAQNEAKSRELSFAAVIDKAVPTLTGNFRNEKHKWQWAQTLSDDYIPHLRSKFVSDIEVADVAVDLLPLWTTKSETAVRLRGRIERVLDYAEGQRLRSGPNPARWGPALKALLGGDPPRIQQNLKALPYAEVASFMRLLQERDASSADAYRFLILTAARLGEVLGASWSEIDWDNRTWIIPATRYKTQQSHTVPLSDQALEILEIVQEQQCLTRRKPFHIFTHPNGKPYSNQVFTALHKRMGVSGFTTHGFRSSFRDWIGNTTDYPREIAEEALGHIIGNKVERAYRRGIALEKRRQLMTEWGNYCTRGEGVNPQSTS